MDPVSQGALGAAAALVVAKPDQIRSVAMLGALAGMAPDLDVFIRSSADPLLFLEYHRQFTHALVFIPVGALICALVLGTLVLGRLSSRAIYWACLLGYGSHGLLDACTSYGTQLFWPFTDARIAWNNVSVIDPLFTVPLVVGVGLACCRHSPRMARSAAMWALAYLLLGVAQRERAEVLGSEIAATRGHAPEELVAKPAFGSLLLWRTFYEHEGAYYVDAARLGFAAKVFAGERAAKFDTTRDVPWLSVNSQQARDVERFRWFSNDYLALDPGHPQRVIDVRYSMVPTRIEALWGIELEVGAAPDVHARFFTERRPSKAQRQEMLRLLTD